MLVIGLTGGIGSGKSAVAGLLAQHDAVVIDADVVARQVVEPGSTGFEAIVARFGRSVISGDGGLDRGALADLAFSDEDALADLNGIVHPLVRSEIRGQLDQLRETDAVVVLVVPLLVESQGYPIDRLVVVDCPEDVAMARVVANRGWTEQQVRQRMAAQATREQRRSAADLVIENAGSRESLVAQVERAWQWILSQR